MRLAGKRLNCTCLQVGVCKRVGCPSPVTSRKNTLCTGRGVSEAIPLLQVDVFFYTYRTNTS